MIKLALAGCGRLGTQICQSLGLLQDDYMLGVYDRHFEKIESVCDLSPQHIACPQVSDLLAFAPHFLIEAASRDFVKEEVSRVLTEGINVLCLSSGALAEPNVRSTLLNAAEIGNTRLYLPAAPPATDAVAVLRLAGVQSAKYRSARGVGHPRAQAGREGVYYSGSVQEAMKEFPKALNPAAALAEVAAGYQSTVVEVAFESRIAGYEFVVEAESSVGSLKACLMGPVEDDWTFCKWASLCTIALLSKLTSRLVVGL